MINLIVCDARKGTPILHSVQLSLGKDEIASVGLALVRLGFFLGQHDPALARKGCFGVFGKRKEWDSPIYSGDRLELYAPLLIDPKTVRRKKANQNSDFQLKAAAARRKARRL